MSKRIDRRGSRQSTRSPQSPQRFFPERYTVKRYESEKEKHPDFHPIVLTLADEEQLQVVAELVEVLTNEA